MVWRRWRALEYCRTGYEALESRKLMAVDVTVTQLADFSPGVTSSEFSNFRSSERAIYFNVNDTELWASDGTVEGTRQLGSTELASDSLVKEVLGLALFTVRRGAGTSIWRTDGTPEGTFELLASGNLELKDAVEAHGVAYLTLNSPSGLQLFRSDGTFEGTEQLSSHLARPPVTTSNGLLFAGGLREQTWILRIPNASSAPMPVAPLPGLVKASQALVNDRFVFFMESADETVRPWSSDGTEEGTFPLSDAPIRSQQLGEVAVVNDIYVYTATWHGNEQGIFRTDGTREGTFRISDASHNQFQQLGIADGSAYFFGCECDDQTRVYRTDGTTILDSYYTPWGWAAWDADGQVVIHDIQDLARNRSETLVFDGQGIRDAKGLENAVVMQPLESGRGSSDPLFAFVPDVMSGDVFLSVRLNDRPLLSRRLVEVATVSKDYYYADDGFYFTNHTTTTGTEVWVSDATPEGTERIDLFPGPTSLDPQLINWQGRMLMVATTPEFGRELWRIETESIPNPVRIQVSDVNIAMGVDVKFHAEVFGIAEPEVLWDIDGDGAFDDAVGLSPELTWEEINALLPPGWHSVSARFLDPASGEWIQDEAGLSLPTSLGFDFIPDEVDVGENVPVRIATNAPLDQIRFIGGSYRAATGELKRFDGAEFIIPADDLSQAGIYTVSASLNLGNFNWQNAEHRLSVGPTIDAITDREVTIAFESDLDASRLLVETRGFTSLPTFTWDLDGDGVFNDAVGRTPVIQWNKIAEQSPIARSVLTDWYEIQVKANDSSGRTATKSIQFGVVHPKPQLIVSELPIHVDERLELQVRTDRLRNPGFRLSYVNEATQRSWRGEVQSGDDDLATRFDVRFPEAGIYSVSVELMDESSWARHDSVQFALAVGNGVSIDRSFHIFEGADLQLAARSLAPELELAYSWDLDGDGNYDDASGPSPSLQWAELKTIVPTLQKAQVIGVQGIDRITGATYQATADLLVRYLPPRQYPPVFRQQPDTNGNVELAFDVVAFDATESLQYTVDYWIEGAEPTQVGPKTSPRFTLALPGGSYAIRVSVSDGMASSVVNYSVDVPPPGDTNGDFQVDFADFLVLSANFGAKEADRSSGDFTGDGLVGFEDFLLLAHSYAS